MCSFHIHYWSVLTAISLHRWLKNRGPLLILRQDGKMRQRWKPVHASGRHCCSSTFSIFVQRTCPCHYTETSVKSSEAPCISFFLKVLLAQTWMCNFWFMPSSLYYSVDDTWRAPVIKPTITCQALTPIYDWVAVAVIFEVRGEGEAYVIGGRQPLRNEILQTCCPRELSESILACCHAITCIIQPLSHLNL